MLDRAGDVTDFPRAAGSGRRCRNSSPAWHRRKSHRTTFPPARPPAFPASPMTMVYLPAGKCAMVTVKFVPLISSRKAAALLAAPSMATDASSLRCANSPLTLTSCPQLPQISSSAKTPGTPSHKQASDATLASASDPGIPPKAGHLPGADVHAGNRGSRRIEGFSVWSNATFLS